MFMDIKLEDIFPDEPEFYLSTTKKTYRLRLPTLEDHVWMKRTFGDENNLNKVLKDLQWDQLCRIVYRLLKQEDRQDFLATDAEITSDEGEAVTVRLTGPQMLLRSIGSIDEGVKVISALTKAITLSSPMIDEYVKAELKKKMTDPEEEQSGLRSSTSFTQSTAGLPSTSSQKPLETSTSHSEPL